MPETTFSAHETQRRGSIPNAPVSIHWRRPLTRRLDALASLSRRDKDEVDAAHGRTLLGRGGTAFEPGPGGAWAVVSGMLARTRRLGDGRRLITEFLLPGDRVKNVPFHDPCYEIECLSDALVADISALDPLTAEAGSDDNLARALALSDAFDAAVTRNAMDRMTRQSGFERVCHLLLDLAHRLQLVQMSDGRSFTFPASLAEIGDALGLSTVQVSRIMSQLRKEGVVQRDRTRIVFDDAPHLAARIHFAVPGARLIRPKDAA